MLYQFIRGPGDCLGNQSTDITIQLGLRGRVLDDFAKIEIIEIIDMTGFVNEQRSYTAYERIAELVTPIERVYIPDNPDIRTRIQLD